jgi:hypothetical protein
MRLLLLLSEDESAMIHVVQVRHVLFAGSLEFQ